MAVLKHLLSPSKTHQAIILTGFAMALCIVGLVLTVWLLMNIDWLLREDTVLYIERNVSPEDQERRLIIKPGPLIVKLDIFLILFHIKGLLIHISLIISIVKMRPEYLIICVAANILRVVCVSIMLLYLAAVCLAFDSKLFQYVAIGVLLTMGMLIGFHFKFSKHIYDLSVAMKKQSLILKSFNKSQSTEKIINKEMTMALEIDGENFVRENVTMDSQESQTV